MIYEDVEITDCEAEEIARSAGQKIIIKNCGHGIETILKSLKNGKGNEKVTDLYVSERQNPVLSF